MRWKSHVRFGGRAGETHRSRDGRALRPDPYTYVPTLAGFLYLAIVLDVFSRKIVGWAMETHLRTGLVLAALEMAILQRKPKDVIHHSDQGCQYTSVAFGRRCEQLGVRPSMGSVGDAYDNAMAESFFATLEWELLKRKRFAAPVEARMAIFEWIEAWYNRTRRHSSLGYLSPDEFEKCHAEGVPQPRVEQRSSVVGQPGESISSAAARGSGGSAPAPRERWMGHQTEPEPRIEAMGSSSSREIPESA